MDWLTASDFNTAWWYMSGEPNRSELQSPLLPKQVRNRSIPASPNKKPIVVIIGGGIAGLTVAHELVMEGRKPGSECELDIVILEKRSAVGGKARSEWNLDKFSEHSMRVLPGSYVCMHQIMREIPRGNGNVLDMLQPVVIRFKHGKRQHTIRGDYRTRFLGSVKYVRDVFGLLVFLMRAGVRIRDLYVFISKVARLMFLPTRRVTEELSRLKFSDYVGGEDGRPGRFDAVYRAAEILVAAKSHSSAGVVSYTLLEWFVTPFLKGKHVRHAISEFTAATSDALIQPWVSFLEENGVRFEQACVKKIDAPAGRVHDVQLDETQLDDCSTIDKDSIEGDVFVLAVQHNIVDALIGDGLRKQIPSINNFPDLGEEWAHSVQFQIPELKGELADLDSIAVAAMDSPWSIAYRVYSRRTWRGEWPGADNGGVFTATISNTRRPGILFHLPFLRCTPDEILQEVIAQTGLEKELDIADGDLGLDLQVISGSDAAVQQNLGHAIAAIGPNTDEVYMTDSQMYIRLPGNLDIEPDNATSVYNFFLAGEYTRTRYRIPTMEKSCESGKRCAQAIISGLGCGIPRDVPTCHPPLEFIRSEYFHLLVRRVFWLSITIAIIWLIYRQF